ncbi:hypothetical protein PVAND_014739 [Polypedilum vanderplanki]|uniref:Globin n=1 Tax=Polypedilum vanderplanki TaxID=319348 RepID=S6BNF1_POLVA|nr:hypothetical protein PVAND_014739 [Polypedilum vanderplanki]BAN67579.1 globin [Polypedilum vanderplanki]
MKFLIVLACIAAASAAPLSHDEAELLKGAWDQIKHNEVDILAAVFSAHPDIQARFPKFAGKELSAVKGSADFAIHASRIVSFISEVISLSGNEATLPAIKSIVSKLGHDHKNRGISKDQFNEFRSALTDYASSHASWNDNVAAAWNHAIDNVYAIIFAALEH